MISKICIGTAQFGLNYGVSNSVGIVPFSECEKIIAMARSNGARRLDTAFTYGKSEETLGEIGVTDFEIISKLPEIKENTSDVRSFVFESVEKSLEKLKVKKLYGLLLHRPNDLIKPHGDKLYDCLLQLKASSLVDKIGISVYEPEELIRYENYNIDLIQFPMNPFDIRFYESKAIENLSSQGVEIHVRSIFLQGLLLMSKEDRKPYFNKWEKNWNNWHSYLIEKKISALEACLGFISKFHQISNWVVGVNSLSQFDEILNVTNSLRNIEYSTFPETDVELLNPVHWIGKL